MPKIKLCFLVTLCASIGWASVELGAPFADRMVLQRERTVPVWGKASPGEKVTVAFAGQSVSTKASETGAWRVDLAPMNASSESRELIVSGADSEARVKDVLVGEVWFASGQSNMECPIWGGNPRYRDGKGAMMIAMTRRPRIRWAKNAHAWSAAPKAIDSVTWRDFSPESVAAANGSYLSAVAYYYALELYGALEIPVGIIDSSWGGTNIDAWTPRCGYEGHPELKDVADYPVTEAWKAEMKKGAVSGAHQQPTVLWNGMVDAWAPFAIRGFIWYQGCNNNGEARRYCAKMHALYDGWAKAFQNPDLKLYFVELAPYRSSWFELQRAQMKFAAEERNAALAVVSDAGNLDDIHPNDKEIVAKRLALHALKRDYGFANIEDESPVLKSWKVENGAFVMTFDHAAGWYVYAPNRSVVPNFEIAGADGVFVPAKLRNVEASGKVKGKNLVVSADAVKDPVRLRYLFKTPFTGTVYSDAALPLGSFDIDARTNLPKRVGAPVKLGEAERIPELAGYRKVLTLDLPAGPDFERKPPAVPAVEGDVTRVAYLLELEDDKGEVSWAMTAMDAFASDPKAFGVPCRASDRHQGPVRKLTVRSNLSNVTPVTEAEGGCIEFWAANYGTDCAIAGIGGSPKIYDFNDNPNAPSIGYGSMQVHNAKAGETIWAFNHFNTTSTADIGIGNNEWGEHKDWTFMSNASEYKTRRLSVYVR